MYIESDAWVTNLKQKLACGSVLMSNQMEFYEFFTRALVPGVHYIEIDSRNLCHDAARQVSCTAATVAFHMYARAYLRRCLKVMVKSGFHGCHSGGEASYGRP